jgi:hypothetical protein
MDAAAGAARFTIRCVAEIVFETMLHRLGRLLLRLVTFGRYPRRGR